MKLEKPAALFFLPGALGRTEFWRPVAGLLTYPAERVHVSWPGFGGIAPDPAIEGIDDLATRLLASIDRPSALIAQSMGGVVAMLHIIPGGGHDLACAFAGQVAPLIERHLGRHFAR
jgi:surfactin synthase thioesterase subunit